MKYLIYVSTAVKIMTDADLAIILNESNRYNKEFGITRMLIYSEGSFIQVLEGEENEVDKLFDKICLDSRHKNIIKLTDDSLAERNFPEWSMAFTTIAAKDFKKIGGYTDPSHKSFIKTDSSHSAIILLKTFAKNNRIIS